MRRSQEKVPARICWEELVAHEPRLDELLAEARAVTNDDPDFCRDNYLLYGSGPGLSMKKRLSQMLNPHRGPHAGSFLAGGEALAVAWQTLYEALPPCRSPHCPPCWPDHA